MRSSEILGAGVTSFDSFASSFSFSSFSSRVSDTELEFCSSGSSDFDDSAGSDFFSSSTSVAFSSLLTVSGAIESTAGSATSATAAEEEEEVASMAAGSGTTGDDETAGTEVSEIMGAAGVVFRAGAVTGIDVPFFGAAVVVAAFFADPVAFATGVGAFVGVAVFFGDATTFAGEVLAAGVAAEEEVTTVFFGVVAETEAVVDLGIAGFRAPDSVFETAATDVAGDAVEAVVVFVGVLFVVKGIAGFLAGDAVVVEAEDVEEDEEPAAFAANLLVWVFVAIGALETGADAFNFAFSAVSSSIRLRSSSRSRVTSANCSSRDFGTVISNQNDTKYIRISLCIDKE